MLTSRSSGNSSDAEFLDTPLAVFFSFEQSPIESFSVEDIWEDGKVDSMKVSKWVAAKLKGVAACLGVAFSGYEMRLSIFWLESRGILSFPSQVF